MIAMREEQKLSKCNQVTTSPQQRLCRLVRKYRSVLGQLDALPRKQKKRTRRNYLILKEFEEYHAPEERIRLGREYRRKRVLSDYCTAKNISVVSFYRWSKLEKEFGILGLIPKYGKWKDSTFNGKWLLSNQEGQLEHHRPLILNIRVKPKQPLKCFIEIRQLLEDCSVISKEQRAAVSMGLQFLERFPSVFNFKPQHLEIPPEDLKRLERYRAKNHKRQSIRASVLLMAHAGKCLFEIVVSTGVAKNSVLRWLRNYKKSGLDFIETRNQPEQRAEFWKERSTRVFDILHSPPGSYDVNRTSWTYDTIIKVYEGLYQDHLPKTSLKRIIKEGGYTWCHARQVLTSPDPRYKEKLAKVLDTLHAVKENEAFFFIDEMGPYRVRKYGGKALVPKGKTRKAPEFQKDKGAVHAVAALEAYTNQLTWLFIDHKDAGSIIALLELLKEKYRSKKRLFLTWDAISTHDAKVIKEWINATNQEAKSGDCPSFNVVPLPSRAQFLNVIESVFGGMKTSRDSQQ